MACFEPITNCFTFTKNTKNFLKKNSKQANHKKNFPKTVISEPAKANGDEPAKADRNKPAKPDENKRARATGNEPARGTGNELAKADKK